MASQLRSSCPEAGVPSLTQALRMRVRSSSVASVSRDVIVAHEFSFISVSACFRRDRECGFGFGDDAVDQLAGGDDLADEAGALAAGGVAIVDVAVLARPDRRGKAHALGLKGKRLDLRGALLPLAREVVPDGAAGLAGGARSPPCPPRRWRRCASCSCRDRTPRGVAMKRVPIHTPTAPSASAARRPRPSAMPPAASTGVGATASTAAGTSTMPPMRPVCPPASCPCAITASTPLAAWSRACFTLPQSAMTLMPRRCASAVTGPGLPSPAMSTGTRSSSVTSIQPLTWSVNCSTSSPAARWSRRACRRRMAGRSCRARAGSPRAGSPGCRCAAAMTPSPPASDTAAASAERATQPMPAWQIG